MTITQQFLKAAKERMDELDWSDARMCREAGISKGAWSEYRTGKRDNLTAETMQRVSDVLTLEIVFKPTPLDATAWHPSAHEAAWDIFQNDYGCDEIERVIQSAIDSAAGKCRNCTDLEHCGSEFCTDPRRRSSENDQCPSVGTTETKS